jgi:hypothetical protein
VELNKYSILQSALEPCFASKTSRGPALMFFPFHWIGYLGACSESGEDRYQLSDGSVEVAINVWQI